MMKIVMKMQQTTMNKSNKTDEMQVVAGDNRIRRLIPSSVYAPHYNQNSDFNYFPMVSERLDCSEIENSKFQLLIWN